MKNIIFLAMFIISISAFGQAIQRNAITLTPPNTPFAGTTWSNTTFAGSNRFSGPMVFTTIANTNAAFNVDGDGNGTFRKVTAREAITASPTNGAWPIQVIPNPTGSSTAFVVRDNANARNVVDVDTNGNFNIGNAILNSDGTTPPLTLNANLLGTIYTYVLSPQPDYLAFFNTNGTVANVRSKTNTSTVYFGKGYGMTDTTITYNPSATNYTYTFLGRAGDHVIITNTPNLFLTLAGAVDGDVAFAIESTNNIYIDYGGNSVEWLTPSNNPTASQGNGTLGISKFGSLVKVSFIEGAISTTNFLSAIQTYSTNATLVSSTSLVVQFSPGFSDTNYVVTAPNDLVGATVTARTPTNFTLGFTAATLTSQVIEGGVIHR